MLAACNNHRRPEVAGPVLSGPSDAAKVVRLSATPDVDDAVVLVLCGPDHRVVLTVVVDGATVAGVRAAIDLVLQVADTAGVTGLVVGIVRHRGGRLSRADEWALAGLVARCDAAGVDLLDLLVVGRRGWRSLWHLADLPEEGEDDEQ